MLDKMVFEEKKNASYAHCVVCLYVSKNSNCTIQQQQPAI